MLREGGGRSSGRVGRRKRSGSLRKGRRSGLSSFSSCCRLRSACYTLCDAPHLTSSVSAADGTRSLLLLLLSKLVLLLQDEELSLLLLRRAGVEVGGKS